MVHCMHFILFHLQLGNTKTQDNKSTLLHFLAETLEKKYPELLTFADELIHVEQAARGLFDSVYVIHFFDSTIFTFSLWSL